MFLFGNKGWLPSLKAQWIIGALIAMLPLLAAMAYAVMVMDRHNQAQRDLVLISAHIAEIGTSVSDQARDLERYSRQYFLLKDDRFRVVFEQTFSDLTRSLRRLQALTKGSLVAPKIELLTENMSTLQKSIFISQKDGESIVEDFKKVHIRIKLIRAEASHWVQTQLDELDTSYEESQWHLVVMGAWVLPASLILAWLISFMVLRPIYQLSKAIKKMGKGDWPADIRITGSSEMVSLGERLAWMQKQLQTLEAQKQSFLQQITHELKTPLAAIMEAGSLLFDEVPGDLNAQQKQVLNILQSNADNLQTLIQQLLDYNSVLRDQVRQVQENNIKTLLNEKLQDLQGLAEARQVNLILRGEPLNLYMDSLRVSMIVRNLVSNAVQLTPSGTSVVVSWGREKGCWWIQVVDEGPGVLPQDMDRLFEPFYQGGAKRQGSLKGSGIGLAIVKECTEFLGGAVEVVNIPQKGACFRVELPILKAQNISSASSPLVVQS